jgi:hypothetical protein
VHRGSGPVTVDFGSDLRSRLQTLAWYTLGALALAGGVGRWASAEPGIIVQQRIVLSLVGVIAGGLALVTSGQWLRPESAEARASMADSSQSNIGPQPRSLANPVWGDLKAEMLSHLPRDRDITVMAPMGDPEAMDFALQIRAFLAANGFKLKESGISQGVFTQAQHGLSFDPETNTFVVGSQ